MMRVRAKTACTETSARRVAAGVRDSADLLISGDSERPGTGPVDATPDRMADAVMWLAVAAVAAAVMVTATQSVVAGAIALPAAVVLARATVTDVRRHRIPRHWVDVASVATVGVLALRGMADGTFDHLAAGLATAAVTWALWWTIRVTCGNGLGYGDVRLATLAALPLGGLSWSASLLLTPAVFVVAAVLLLPLRATVRGGRMALAPAMALAWCGVLCLAAAVPVGNAG